mgnify:CR=1 FL=1
MSSTYHKEFYKKQGIPNVVTKANEYDKPKGGHLEMKTMYGQKFVENQVEKPEKCKGPDGWLHTAGSDGPLCRTTSYSTGFPGFKGTNQYVKPAKDQTRAGLSFQGKTTYRNTFSGSKIGSKNQHFGKKEDNLKSGGINFGESSYRKMFQQPNPENYQPVRKEIMKQLSEYPKMSTQFSIYQLI